MKKIIFTGGGSAGHVTPNIAVINELNRDGKWDIWYIGTKNGIERDLITEINIKYKPIYAGKLRRYFSIQNFIDIFRTVGGIIQCYFFIKSCKPDIVFSKGGFVGFPVAAAAYANKVPVIIHEADMTPGLANKLSFRFASKICLTFPNSINFLKTEFRKRAVVTGLPLRVYNEIIKGDRNTIESQFSEIKPILFVFGGSLGSTFINTIVRCNIDELLTKFNLIHVCGKDKVDLSFAKEGYRQVEFLKSDFYFTLSQSDFVISRAGANSIFELLYLKKNALFIPLSNKASRGDQIINAKYFFDQGVCEIMLEEEYTQDLFLKKIKTLVEKKQDFYNSLTNLKIGNANKKVAELINQLSDNVLS